MLRVIELLESNTPSNGGKGHVWIEIEFASETIEIRLDENADTMHFRRNDKLGQTVYLKG